ncbi:hypothetical protein CcI156_02950 [Frankia sp. CcI156]|uniref:hypothetical protein n=1 Tax=Frankia TaxID=1854 RepID=UPI0003CFA56B|nr:MULTISPECIES: hypothetical protein [Frankia]ETA03049.1 hypothetical protein CcI6DRAFT_01573 [Frankia sp. CcI6]KFB05800.1 hypothetical protein ALLO2DRAFT_01438 [Frankia sp. Allo2]OAA30288.1 hypothetical protein AAY23_101090 [Frankia casuarinae]OHV57672.1 hypothetical protein CgIS1_00540 [Frankia sp. CgIS1]ONH29319.1 hypothetical protein CcI156_02950 [Frankia sp. CcI156]
MPLIRGDLKVAKVFDGTADGVPFIVDRLDLPAGRERSDFLAYLRQGAVIMRAAGLDVDQLDESREKRVPIALLTDGEWVWDASIAYYLEEHDLPPEPAFLDYLRGRDFTYVAPTEEQVSAAAAALRAR